MEQITGIKLIIKNEIKEEATKCRDMTSTGESVFGDKSSVVAAAFVCLETELEKKIKRYLDGEDINKLVPNLEPEADYDNVVE